VAKPEQKEELEVALDAVLEDASIYGLQRGDLWVKGKGWTRNVNGEQIVLEGLPHEERSQYQALSDELDDLKANSVTIEELEDAYDDGVQSL
jgi:aconitase B